jgi:septal ring factor EnvC (AmiA/AmiB activator)
VASRYSQLDQQLDNERYIAELDAWRLREQQRRQRWLEGQNARKQHVQQRLNEHQRELSALEPRLKACPNKG